MALQLFVQPRAGELIAQGIDGLTQGIERYYQRKEENEQMERAASFFARAADANPGLAQSLGIKDTKDKAALKAGIKAAGGPMQFMQMGAAMQQMMERQQAAEQDKRDRYAQQDLLDPAMRLANRLDTPEQYGRQIDSNTYLRDAMRMGLPARDSAAVANVMQDTEIAGMRNELAAAKANKQPHTPEVKIIKGPDGKEVRVVSTSANQYQVLKDPKAEGSYTKGQKATLNIDGNQVPAMWDGRRWVDPESQQPVYMELNEFKEPVPATLNPSIAARFAPKEAPPPPRKRLKMTAGRLVEVN